MSDPFEFDVFLSHHSHDTRQIRVISDRLKAHGLKVWFDEREIEFGAHIPSAIVQGLRVSRYLLLCMSKAAFDSEWVQCEWMSVFFQDPLNHRGRLIPLLIEDCEVPPFMQVFRHADCRSLDEEVIKRLAEHCRKRDFVASFPAAVSSSGIAGLARSNAETELRKNLRTGDISPRDLTEALKEFALYDYGPRRDAETKYISPEIVWGCQGSLRPSTSDATQLTPFLQNTPVAVIAPPGCGKSLLLNQFVMSGEANPGTATSSDGGLPALILYIKLGLLKKHDWANWPWDMISQHLDNLSVPRHKANKKKYVELLKLYQAAGQVYLILDGLDEFAVAHKDQVSRLLERCAEMSQRVARVTISCRTWFWNLQLNESERTLFQCAAIMPFDTERALKLLDGRPLPTGAIDQPTGKLKEWLSPLLLSFYVQTVQKPATREANAVATEFRNKTELFQQWTDWLADKEKKAVGGKPSEILEFFGNLAVFLARRRLRLVTVDMWGGDGTQGPVGERDSPKLPTEERLLRDDGPLRSSFLKRVGFHDAEFAHPMIWEFFVASRLESEFRDALRDQDESTLANLKLATTALDYLPSTVYGFLAELLERQDVYEEQLVKWLRGSASRLPKLPKDLLRNLVEFLGKTSLGGREVTESLMTLVEDAHLDGLVRYNAARALERVHPSAPRPYFDFGSDWGVTNWTGRQFDKRTLWEPLAIRGAHRQVRLPGRYPPLDIDFTKRETPQFQQQISDRLLAVIRKCDDRNVRINCSHALVRWCDFRDDRFVEKLNDAIAKVADDETRENLDRWVRKAAWRFRQQEGERDWRPHVSPPARRQSLRRVLGALEPDEG